MYGQRNDIVPDCGSVHIVRTLLDDLSECSVYPPILWRIIGIAGKT